MSFGVRMDNSFRLSPNSVCNSGVMMRPERPETSVVPFTNVTLFAESASASAVIVAVGATERSPLESSSTDAP